MLTGNILMLLALGIFFYFLFKHSGDCCGGHNHGGLGQDDADPREHDDHNHQGMDGPGRAGTFTASSGSLRDPVCGMEIGASLAYPSSEHRGRTFHFCSDQCRKIFDLNPNKFIESMH
jgi:YHS domain-containing protein